MGPPDFCVQQIKRSGGRRGSLSLRVTFDVWQLAAARVGAGGAGGVQTCWAVSGAQRRCKGARASTAGVGLRRGAGVVRVDDGPAA